MVSSNNSRPKKQQAYYILDTLLAIQVSLHPIWCQCGSKGRGMQDASQQPKQRWSFTKWHICHRLRWYPEKASVDHNGNLQRPLQSVVFSSTWYKRIFYRKYKDTDNCLAPMLPTLSHDRNPKFNRRKLHLQKIEVKYMGQILLGEGLKADPNKIKAWYPN